MEITSGCAIFLVADLRRLGPRIGRRSFKFSRTRGATQIGDHGLLTRRPDSRRLPPHKLPKPTVIPRAINLRRSGRREAGRGPDPRQKKRDPTIKKICARSAGPICENLRSKKERPYMSHSQGDYRPKRKASGGHSHGHRRHGITMSCYLF